MRLGGALLVLAVAACAVPAPGPFASRTGATASEDAAELFDDLAPIRVLRLDVAPDDWEWLKANAVAEQYRPATLSFDGGAPVPCHARFKGAYGSLIACFAPDGKRICDKLSMKVSFNETDKSGRFMGQRKLVLNSCIRDPSCIRERLAFALFRGVGVPASRAVHATLSVNGEPAGLFLMIEEVDHEFLERRFDDPDGNLYKEAWPLFTDPAAYVPALRTNEDAPDVSRMVAFATVLGQGTDADFDARVAPFVSVPALLDYLVADAVMSNYDGVTKFYCTPHRTCSNHNVYWYDDPGSGRFVLIPRDLDYTFNLPDTDLGRRFWDDSPDACKVKVGVLGIGTLASQCDPLLRGVVRLHWDAYKARFASLTEGEGPLSVATQQRLIDLYRAQVREAVEADPDSVTPAQWRINATQLREEVVAQHAEVEAFVAGTP